MKLRAPKPRMASVTPPKKLKSLEPMARLPKADMGNRVAKCDMCHPHYKPLFKVSGQKRGKHQNDLE